MNVTGPVILSVQHWRPSLVLAIACVAEPVIAQTQVPTANAVSR